MKVVLHRNDEDELEQWRTEYRDDLPVETEDGLTGRVRIGGETFQLTGASDNVAHYTKVAGPLRRERA